MEIKITKKQVLDCCRGNAYSDAFNTYLVHGKIINDEKTRFRRFKFVHTIYKEEIFAYDDYPEKMTIKRQTEIENEFLQHIFMLINNYNDCNAFYEYCNESIKEYNKKIA